MLQATVFTLGVFSNDTQIDILVPSFITRNVLDQDDRGVDVQLLTKGNVERNVTGARDRCMEDTWECLSVLSERMLWGSHTLQPDLVSL